MRAHLVHQDPVIEEQVTLRVGGVELVAFAEVCPYPIFVGNDYDVELVAVCLDDPQVGPAPAGQETLEHLGGYRYQLCGRLEGESLHCLGLLVDIGDCVETTWPDGSYVALRADRIGANFV